MLIRKVLLPLTGITPCEPALAAGFAVAARFRAHLAAVHVEPDSRDVAPLAGEGLSGAMIEDMMSATEKEAAERADACRRVFDRMAAERQIPLGPPRSDAASAGIVMLTGREEEVVSSLARISDLTVIAHPEWDEDDSSSETLHAALFDSRRPVLIAPRTASASIGRRCCIAWNGTAESAAAVWAMLPWLMEAEAVCVLHAEEYQRQGPDSAELLEYLALHGVHAEAVEFRPVEREVGAGLLVAAHEFGADLLGMGAYSHSRLRQMILGGVTRHVLGHAELPVLMCR